MDFKKKFGEENALATLKKDDNPNSLKSMKATSISKQADKVSISVTSFHLNKTKGKKEGNEDPRIETLKAINKALEKQKKIEEKIRKVENSNLSKEAKKLKLKLLKGFFTYNFGTNTSY